LVKPLNRCGQRTAYDYSGFNVNDPTQQSAKWAHLPGPSVIFGDTTPSGLSYVLTKRIGATDQYLIFLADKSHVFVSSGRPTAYASWHRISGNDISQSYGKGSELFVHVDPHSIAVSDDINLNLKRAAGVPFPWDQNSELDHYYSGKIWMANDGGVYQSRDGGSTWQLMPGLATLQPNNIAGLAGAGSLPALYMGTGDNYDFFSLDGGSSWENSLNNCADCSQWYSDPAQPNRVFEPRPGWYWNIYINANKGAYPNAGDISQLHSVPIPENSRWYRPIIQTAPGEDPLSDGDYILVNGKQLLRTTNITDIKSSDDWNTKATQQGTDLPSVDIQTIQASGGHTNPVFYVGDSNGLWKWKRNCPARC
jgi:hypothetical protein